MRHILLAWPLSLFRQRATCQKGLRHHRVCTSHYICGNQDPNKKTYLTKVTRLAKNKSGTRNQTPDINNLMLFPLFQIKKLASEKIGKSNISRKHFFSCFGSMQGRGPQDGDFLSLVLSSTLQYLLSDFV